MKERGATVLPAMHCGEDVVVRCQKVETAEESSLPEAVGWQCCVQSMGHCSLDELQRLLVARHQDSDVVGVPHDRQGRELWVLGDLVVDWVQQEVHSVQQGGRSSHDFNK